MEKHPRHRRTRGPLLLPLVLLCVALVSVYLITGLVARFTTSAQTGDSARVAKFSIQGSSTLETTVDAPLAPGEWVTRDIVIENNSEVAVKYTVTVRNATQNLPLTFSMTGDDHSPVIQPGSALNSFTAQRLPGDHTDTYTLTVTWPETERDPARMGMVDDITVTVMASQTD